MKIAAAYDNGTVCQDFAQTKQFKLYTIEDDHISQREIVDAEGDPAQCLKQHGAGLLVCGKLDMMQQMALMQAGIAPFPGAYGEADMQVGALFVRMLESEKQEKQQQDACPTPEEGGCASCAHRDACQEYGK